VKNNTGNDNACQYTGTNSTNVGISCFMTLSCVISEWCAEKSW